MNELTAQSLSKWIKVTLVFLMARTGEEYRTRIYSLWPILQDAMANDCAPVLKALKQELKEWTSELDENQRAELESRLAEHQQDPGSIPAAHELENMICGGQMAGSRDLTEGQGSLCSA